MANLYPDLEWYATASERKGLPSPRCPFAAAARCPRYYQSLYLLGHSGSTAIEEADDKKLHEFWKNSDLWPLTREQETSVSGPPDGRKTFIRFCPEVAFERFGLFATDLIPYPDVEDSEYAREKLAKTGVDPDRDYRWDWWRIHEMHYSACPLYSLLPYIPATGKTSASSEELVEMKPSIGGVRLNLKVLFTRLARWWLKRQTPK